MQTKVAIETSPSPAADDHATSTEAKGIGARMPGVIGGDDYTVDAHPPRRRDPGDATAAKAETKAG
jgi:hypothetical protein